MTAANAQTQPVARPSTNIEVWALLTAEGFYVPPIDDDGTDCFMAWPSKAEAEKGREHQLACDYIDEDTKVVRVI